MSAAGTGLTIILDLMRMILMTDRPLVRLRGASIGYERVPVVRGVDLEIDAGEVVALLGPNGSGKSTLVRGMLGLAQVLGGEVELFGQPVSRLRERWRVGYVPQRLANASGLPTTVAEVVACGRLPRLAPWRRFGKDDRAHVAAAIEAVGLAGFERRPMLKLSGGQQRRALIARALASEAELLVLDEPTAGVDAASQRALADTVEQLAGGGATILYITHEPGPVAHLCTRAVELRGGAIVYDGPVSGASEHGDDHHHHAEHPSPSLFGTG
jgi:zinc transport system ATP-binding protein